MKILDQLKSASDFIVIATRVMMVTAIVVLLAALWAVLASV